jgi:dTMP kinase
MADRGRFITFEGPEGGGKSTQVRRLADRLKKAGRTVLMTREPGGTATGEAIREILQHDRAGEPISPEAELLLFEASRAQLARRVILPALDEGVWVICDRFADSTAAYQGYGRGFNLATVLDINGFAMGTCVPDLTLLLDIEAQTGLGRVVVRNKQHNTTHDRFEREQVEFHERVRAGYLQLARRWPERIRIVDAMRDEEAVSSEVWRMVSHAFGL